MLVSMRDLFPKCEEILRCRMCPMHYGKLADEALRVLKIQAAGKELSRVREDVREKMLEAEQQGSFYVPSPHCLAVLKEWFPANKEGEQPELFNHRAYEVRISGNASWSVEAAAETHMRRPYLKTKVADCWNRWHGLSRGFIIQEHVSRWFQMNWPEYWMPPENDGKFKDWCDHDFKLLIRGVPNKVDAMGPRSDDYFGSPKGGGKHPVSFHIAASLLAADVIVHGYILGKNFGEDFKPENTLPICHLVVLLNCQKDKIDYSLLRSWASRRQSK